MNTILYFIECCCYNSQRLTTLQSFWWRLSMGSTERIDDHCILQGCCLCSWQSTIGPHSLLLWPGTIEVILRHGSSVTHVEDKTIEWYCHLSGQHQLGFNICCVPCQLLLCCGLRRMSSGANLAPESLHTVCASGTLQDAQVSDAHCPVTNNVDCPEEFYSFTNQAFVSWCLGACQEWWRWLARSTCSAWWCADTSFCCHFCNQQCCLSRGATRCCFLPWRHKGC